MTCCRLVFPPCPSLPLPDLSQRISVERKPAQQTWSTHVNAVKLHRGQTRQPVVSTAARTTCARVASHSPPSCLATSKKTHFFWTNLLSRPNAACCLHRLFFKHGSSPFAFFLTFICFLLACLAAEAQAAYVALVPGAGAGGAPPREPEGAHLPEDLDALWKLGSCTRCTRSGASRFLCDTFDLS